MNMTFKQIFLQQKDLEQTLYGKFGYKVESMQQIVERKKKHEQFPVTANIKLRKVTPSLYKNGKIQQVEKEIQQLKKDRKRREEESKINRTQDLDKYIDKMNHIVNQYNYLIDHKHIKEKGSEEARKMLNIRPKTDAQKAVQQIAVLKEQLIHANLQQQFILNRKINNLYRIFNDNIDQGPEKHLNRKRAISQQIKQEKQNRTQSFRVMSRMMQESQRASSINSKPELKYHDKNQLNNTMMYSLNAVKSQNQKSENYLNVSLNEVQLRKIKSHNAEDVDLINNFSNNMKKQTSIIEESYMSKVSPSKAKQEKEKLQKKKQDLQQSIIQPYVSKTFIQNGKKMDIKIKNNSEALQLWKGRIAESLPATKEDTHGHVKSKKKIQPQDSSKLQAEQQKYYNRIKNEELELKQHVPYIENKKNFKHETVQSLRMKNLQQEEILSGLLEKRNCKYLRPWGTKIFVKYDASKQAKQMLGLSPSKDPKEKSEAKTRQNTSEIIKASSHQKQKSQEEKKQLQLDLNFKQNQQENNQMDWNKQIDEEYYWTMCKNEKINLLLKGKRR